MKKKSNLFYEDSIVQVRLRDPYSHPIAMSLSQLYLRYAVGSYQIRDRFGWSDVQNLIKVGDISNPINLITDEGHKTVFSDAIPYIDVKSGRELGISQIGNNLQQLHSNGAIILPNDNITFLKGEYINLLDVFPSNEIESFQVGGLGRLRQYLLNTYGLTDLGGDDVKLVDPSKISQLISQYHIPSDLLLDLTLTDPKYSGFISVFIKVNKESADFFASLTPVPDSYSGYVKSDYPMFGLVVDNQIKSLSILRRLLAAKDQLLDFYKGAKLRYGDDRRDTLVFDGKLRETPVKVSTVWTSNLYGDFYEIKTTSGWVIIDGINQCTWLEQ